MRAIVKGGAPLRGTVEISGYKHSVLPIMAAAYAMGAEAELLNVPSITDVRLMSDILRDLGVKVDAQDARLYIDARSTTNTRITMERTRGFHASYQIMPGLLSRFGRFEVGPPGGDRIGDRMLSHSIGVMSEFGAHVAFDGCSYQGRTEGLVPARVTLADTPPHEHAAVTKLALILAALVDGTSTISGWFQDPCIADLSAFLEKFGCSIELRRGDLLVRGCRPTLAGRIRHEIVPDCMESLTYVVAALMTQGSLRVTRGDFESVPYEMGLLDMMGARLCRGSDSVVVAPSGQLTAGVDLVTAPYPGLHTDLQPILASLLAISRGRSTITETVWRDRFRYATELSRQGVCLKVMDQTIVLDGSSSLRGAAVRATDIRGGMAVLLAALVAPDTTTIEDFELVCRAYSGIGRKLQSIGANIELLDASRAETATFGGYPDRDGRAS